MTGVAASRRTSPAGTAHTPRRRAVLASLGPVTAAGLCAAGVATLADAAREGDGLAAFDPAVTGAVVASRSPELLAAANAVTWLGSATGVVTLALLLVILLTIHARLYRRDNHTGANIGDASDSGPSADDSLAESSGGRWSVTTVSAAWLGVALAGSLAWTVAIKAVVARPRPGRWMVAGPLETGYAFPSGHTLNTAVLAGMGVGLVVWRTRSIAARVASALAACILVLAVGVSRVYLGYHWVSDVVAGVLVAVGWLALLFACLRLLRGRLTARATNGRSDV